MKGILLLTLSFLAYFPSLAQCPKPAEVEVVVKSEGELAFHFKSSDLKNAKKIELVKMGAGIQRDRRPSISKNILTYTNLPGGEYMLRITGQDGCSAIIGTRPKFKGIEVVNKN